MIELASVIGAVFIFLCGYFSREIVERIKKLEESVKAKTVKKEPESEVSVLIDPDDIRQRAEYEHKELMKKLNP